MRVNLIESLGSRSEPSPLVKRKARRELGQRMKPKKKRVKKNGGVLIDLTTSDKDVLAATSTEPLAEVQVEVQAKANDDSGIDLARSDGDNVADSQPSKETKQQGQAGVSGKDKKELSEEEIQALLWKYVVRAREKEAAELKERNEKNVQEGRPIEQPTTDSWSDSDESEEEPWTLDEDEELARWKLGGFGDEQLDWPTFHESRTWDDLMARLDWLETQHPKCWAVLKVLEDEDQELAERELTVEIEDMKAKGLLSSSSDEMLDDEIEEGSVEGSDEDLMGE